MRVLLETQPGPEFDMVLPSVIVRTSRQTAISDLRARLTRFLEPHDPALIEAGAGGERLVAWTRLFFWIFVCLAPLSAVVVGGREAPLEMTISLIGALSVIVISIIVIWLVEHRTPGPWFGFWTGAIDITLLTLIFVSMVFAGQADAVIHSQSAWAVYILVIMTTCLRFDVRVCLFTGLLAVLEYCLLLLWIDQTGQESLTRYDLLIQTTRCMLIIAASALCVGIVNRTSGLIRASGFDQLTGLATRAYFQERLRSEMNRTRRSQSPLSLAIFDIDHFKQFNDRFGHRAGDEALKTVAGAMQHEKRGQDFLARWGGEEIAMILPDTAIEQAIRAVQRIATRVRETPVVVNGRTQSLTVSVGVSQLGVDAEDDAELFAVADRRLYAAKASGRDRTVSDG